MTAREKPSRFGGVQPGKAAPAALALLLPLLSGGCFIFHRAAPQPPTLVINQPIVLSTPPVVNVPAPRPAPPPAPAPPRVETAKTTPPPRRPRRSHPIREAERAEKTAPPAAPAAASDQPQLTPQLSAGDAENYRRTTNEWLDAAQHDLALISGRTLSSADQATRLQATEYISQSRQALGQGDLVRAQNLAHKALVLADAILQGS